MRELDPQALEIARQKLRDYTGPEPGWTEAIIHAYLDATAPSRAPDGGVTREEIAALIREHVSGVAWIDGRTRKIPSTVGSEDAADAIFARLAASPAGDRERLESWAKAALLFIDGDAIAGAEMETTDGIATQLSEWGYEVLGVRIGDRAALAPAAGQEDAGECG